MKILIVHNFYQQAGGEDIVFVNEKTLLKRYSHNVITYERYNEEIKNYSFWQKVGLVQKTIWASENNSLLKLLKKETPDIVHFHNTFPLISPSSYALCHDIDIPVVQTLHNYRLLCPNANFYHKDKICEKCVGRIPPWSGLLQGCYRSSRLQTSVVAAMLTVHWWLNTWESQVDAYIALSKFARAKFIEGGLPERKIFIKPNFVDSDHEFEEGDGKFAIFVGRLAPEKGILTLIEAWENLKEIPLKIIGDGPLRDDIVRFAKKHNNIEFLGRKDYQEYISYLRDAKLMLYPSGCYETFGRAIIEAFAYGVPVIASRHGAMAEIVDDRRTGLLFEPSNPEDLADKLKWAYENPGEIEKMSRRARREFETKYTSDKNYRMLMDIYAWAIEERKRH